MTIKNILENHYDKCRKIKLLNTLLCQLSNLGPAPVDLTNDADWENFILRIRLMGDIERIKEELIK